MAAGHPTTADLQSLFAGTGLVPDPTAAPYNAIDWASNLTRAIKGLRAETGRVFGASTTPATRTYDPPMNRKGVLTLGEEAISVSSVTVRGVPMTLGADYFLGPENADQDGEPWQWIEFAAPFDYPLSGAMRRSVQVTGLWGYSTDVPDDVFDAEVKYAGWLVAQSVAVALSKGLVGIVAGDSEKRFSSGRDAGPLASESTRWLESYRSVVAARKRVAVGL